MQPIIPREYQSRADIEIDAKVAGGCSRLLCVAPTGAGKSVSIGMRARKALDNGQTMVILQHRIELLNQNLDKVLRAGIDVDSVGVIRASDKRYRSGAPIQLASVDTLRGWVSRSRGLPPADWIIIDEAHRSAAASYQKIVAAYPNANLLGFTATPWRLDGKGLSDYYDDIVVMARIPELITQTHLVTSRCYSHPRAIDMSSVKITAGDFNEKDLTAVMSSPVLLGDVVEQYRARAMGRAAFGFAVTIEHAQALAATCTAAGIPSACIHGETEPGPRAQALKDLQNGTIAILWNCALYTEGTDVPEVKAIILCRPTMSRALAFQMLGRGMRPAPHTGFNDCVVLDHAGVLPIHGHPCEPQDYSLTSTRVKRTGDAQTKTCPECGQTVPLATVDCECGYRWERAERVGPQTIAGDLVEMRAQAPIELPAIDEERLIRTAFRKALDANARSPLAYAKAILQKQLKREPSRELFEKAAVESLTAKPAVSRPIPPELLRPAVKQPEPIAPAVDPSDWIEVEF